MSSRLVADLHPRAGRACARFVGEVERQLGRHGVGVLITCTYRPPEEQAQLYTQGRYPVGSEQEIEGFRVTVPPGPVVTWVGPWRSWHQYRLAWDVVVLSHGKLDWRPSASDPGDYWHEVGAIAEALGIQWGTSVAAGGERDFPHFQWTQRPGGGGLTLAEVRDLGDLLPEGIVAEVSGG